ncbi:hypothetical protein ABL850_14835 [Variovorax paradoxus]
MTWLTYILIAVSLVLAALPLLIIAIGLPKLKRQLDAQAFSSDDGEGG